MQMFDQRCHSPFCTHAQFYASSNSYTKIGPKLVGGKEYHIKLRLAGACRVCEWRYVKMTCCNMSFSSDNVHAQLFALFARRHRITPCGQRYDFGLSESLARCVTGRGYY
jgi:hypothetical protein